MIPTEYVVEIQSGDEYRIIATMDAYDEGEPLVYETHLTSCN